MSILESPTLFRNKASNQIVLATSIILGICYVKYVRVVDCVSKKHYDRILEGFLRDFEVFE